ncbi:OST-HTH/LOTUS domain-containing protein [bacterium]|nr:OST-HTH/LOTUS domain-containing protein [bacterium]
MEREKKTTVFVDLQNQINFETLYLELQKEDKDINSTSILTIEFEIFGELKNFMDSMDMVLKNDDNQFSKRLKESFIKLNFHSVPNLATSIEITKYFLTQNYNSIKQLYIYSNQKLLFSQLLWENHIINIKPLPKFDTPQKIYSDDELKNILKSNYKELSSKLSDDLEGWVKISDLGSKLSSEIKPKDYFCKTFTKLLEKFSDTFEIEKESFRVKLEL